MNAAGQVVWSEWRELRDGTADTVRAVRYYDAAGRVIEESEPFFVGETARYSTRHEYDDVGTLRIAESPAGRFTYRRTPDHRFATDALGFETTLTLDGRGHVVAGTEPAPGGTIKHVYCADGRLRASIDPEGNTTSIEYDVLGRRRFFSEPNRGKEFSDYDAFDQLVHTRDAGDRDVWLQYDPLGRLVGREDVSGKTEWTFDVAPYGIGALAASKSPDGIVSEYSYHPNGLPESEVLYTDSVSLKVYYGYDRFGRPETIESPAITTRAEYGAGVLVGIRDVASGKSLWEGTSYTARGDLQEERFGNGMIGIREYQPGTGRLTRQFVRLSTETLQDWEYGHDANGRVNSRRERTLGFNEGYDFDPLGRLTKVTSSHDPTLSLDYDRIGNLIWASDVGELSYDETSKPHAVRNFRGFEQHYDSVGNHLGDDVRRRVEYNALDLPSNIFRRKDEASIQIRYDADGNRAATHGPDGDRYYLGPLELRGNVLVHRIQVGSRTVAQATRNKDSSRVDIAYVHDDHLGSTDLVTDDGGEVVARFSYDAWGARSARSWTRSPTGSDGTPLMDHGYTGHEHDDEWGVIHMRGRAYDPAMRRMTGVDPFVVNPFGVQAFNRYSYVLNDPINMVDPSGFNAVAAGHTIGPDGRIHGPTTTVKGRVESGEDLSPPAGDTGSRLPSPRGSSSEPDTSEPPTPRAPDPGPNLVQLGMRYRDMAINAGAGQVRDWVREVNDRGRSSVGGEQLPALDHASMEAEGVAEFFDSVATVHDPGASVSSQGWAWAQIGLVAVTVGSATAAIGALRGASGGSTVATRAAVVGERGAFAGHHQLFSHFTKHGDEFRHASPAEYMAEAQRIMRDGIAVDYMYKGVIQRGFVMFMGQGARHAKFAFVGTNRAGHITTLHVKRAPDLWKLLNGNRNINVLTPAL